MVKMVASGMPVTCLLGDQAVVPLAVRLVPGLVRDGTELPDLGHLLLRQRAHVLLVAEGGRADVDLLLRRGVIDQVRRARTGGPHRIHIKRISLGVLELEVARIAVWGCRSRGGASAASLSEGVEIWQHHTCNTRESSTPTAQGFISRTHPLVFRTML